MDDLINRQLGQYRLTEVIRRGGMSTVYKAYQESLDRYVAVKVLFHGQNPQFVARFQREAHAIAHLQHPNILPVFDYGEQDGLLFLVLQYIEQGMTLGDLLGHPMEPVPALQLMSRVLAALDYAHERGIVHRDVKPANILMPTPSWPMLSDFGIVKLLTESDNPNLTAQGMIVGTPAYLAPEQVLGMHIDRRTDLYSAGIVLYEMVTGRVPFDNGTPIVIATKQAYEPPPPPLTLNPGLPRAVELIVLRALEKDPANRYQTAAEMAAEIDRVARQLDQGRPPLPEPAGPENEDADEDLDDNYMAGIAAFEAGRWDQAVQRLRQVVTVDPTYADAATMLEAAREAQARQPAAAPAAPPQPAAEVAPPAAPPAAPVAIPDAHPAIDLVASPSDTTTTTTKSTTTRRRRRATASSGDTTPAETSAQPAAPAPLPAAAAAPPVTAAAAAAPAPVAGPAPAPAALAPADPVAPVAAESAGPASTTTGTRRPRRRAASADTPAAGEPDQPALPTETTKSPTKTGSTRRTAKAAGAAALPVTPTGAATPAPALPDAAKAAPAPPAPPPAAAAPLSPARELQAAPAPMSAAAGAAAAPAAPAPPPPAAGVADSRPVTQRRSPVPFIAVGAGVLLLILAAIFGPGLLAAPGGAGGSPTPAATVPPTAAAAPSATGLPIAVAPGSATPAAPSPTPAQAATVAPTPAPTEPPTAVPATSIPPTPVPATAAPTMSMPTPPAIPPTTSQGAVGGVQFSDDMDQYVVDRVIITMTLSTLPAPPAGQGRVAWLVNSATGANRNLGPITPPAKDPWRLTYIDPQHANLLAAYDGFVVTNEALNTTPFAPSSDIVARGQLPVLALVHIGHLLVGYPDTPKQVGLEVGLRAQVSALVDHTQRLSTAQAKGNLAGVKQEAEALVNLIEGKKGADYGDLNKDGQITDPGDGFGLLAGPGNTPPGYIQDAADHAELSRIAPDATDNVKQHGSKVEITVVNVRDWVQQIRDKALAINAATDTTATRLLMGDILTIATYVKEGKAVGGIDGNVQPVAGSGGAAASYQEALRMADMPIQPSK